MHEKSNQSNDLDKATQARLACLASVPVNTKNLEHRLNALLTVDAPERNRWHFSQAWRPLFALAAVIVFMAAVGILMMSFGSTPVVAAPVDLARLYSESIKPDSMATSVNSLEDANHILSGQWSDVPKLPASATAQLHACCIHDFMDQKVACLILRDGQSPLTMVVGYSRKFLAAQGRVVERGGRKFTLHEVNGLRMAMTQHDDRFICLMGEVSEERLLAVAEGLKF